MYSNNRSTTKTSNKKKFLLIVSALLATLLMLFVVLEFTNTTNFLSSREEQDKSTDDSFSQPPTDEESNAGDEVPLKQDGNNPDNQNDSQQPDSPVSDETEPETVALVISDIGVYDGNVEVSAFTPDAIANGTCTYVFTSGSNTVTKTNLARADASSSICIDEPFPVSELSASDEWGVGITYKSESGNYIGTQQTILKL